MTLVCPIVARENFVDSWHAPECPCSSELTLVLVLVLALALVLDLDLDLCAYAR